MIPAAETPDIASPIVLGCTLAHPVDRRDGAGRGLRPLTLTREAGDGVTRIVAYDLTGTRLAPLPDAAAARLGRMLDLGHPAIARVSGFTEDGGVEIEISIGAR